MLYTFYFVVSFDQVFPCFFLSTFSVSLSFYLLGPRGPANLGGPNIYSRF